MFQESLFSTPDVYTFEVKRGYATVVFTGYVYARCVKCPAVFPLTLYRIGQDRVASHDQCPDCRGDAPIRNRQRWSFSIVGARRIILTNAHLACGHCGTETQLQLRHMGDNQNIRNQPRCGKCRNER